MKKAKIELDQTASKAYLVKTDSGKLVFEHDDIFRCLAHLKKQPPGSKMIRAADNKLLAYNTTSKLDIDPETITR